MRGTSTFPIRRADFHPDSCADFLRHFTLRSSNLTPGKLSEKLRLAEAAISNRTDESTFEQTSHEERRALADGLYIVRMLRKDKLQ